MIIAGTDSGAVELPGRVVDVVIPNWRGDETLSRVIRCLEAQTVKPRRVIIVDDACPDDSREFIGRSEVPLVVLRNESNRGFAATANRGITYSDAEFVGLLNNDAYPDSRWLEKSLGHFGDPKVVGVAALMVQDRDPQVVDSAGLGFSWSSGVHPRARGRRRSSRDLQICHRIFAPTGGAAVYRRGALPRTPPFDADLIAYNEDADLGWAMYGAGQCCMCCTEAIVRHEGGRSYAHASARHVYLQTRNQLKVLIGNVPLYRHPGGATILAAHLVREAASYAIRHGQWRSVLKAIGAVVISLPQWYPQRRLTRRALGLEGVSELGCGDDPVAL